MPEFDKNKFKIKSRLDLVNFYRVHSGKITIDTNRSFWSLCSIQSQLPNSEINQLVNLGLIRKDQYYGIDFDQAKIKMNIINHPEAHWLTGDWETVIMQNPKIFVPEIVFLDATSLAITESLLRATQRTLCRCPKNAYLFVNLMLNNPHSKQVFDLETFPKKLFEFITPEDWSGWHIFDHNDISKLKRLNIHTGQSKGVLCYPYNCSGWTNMAMYAFWKGENE